MLVMPFQSGLLQKHSIEHAPCCLERLMDVCCRPMVQVPLGYSPLAILHSLPGVPNGVLNITAPILAAIYQCQVTSWNDVSISAANPGLT